MGDIFGDVEDHGTRAAGSGHGKGPAHELGNAMAPFDADQLLHDGREDLGLTGLLGHILARMIPVGISDESHQGNARGGRFHQSGGEVGGSGAQRAVAEPDAAGDPGVAVGGKGAGAFIVDHDMPGLAVAGPGDGIIKREQREAADSEDDLRLVELQHLGHGFPAGHMEYIFSCHSYPPIPVRFGTSR